MNKIRQDRLSSVLCIIGLPQSREVSVDGYNEKGALTHNWDGNSDFHNQLDASLYTKTYLPIIWSNEPERTVKKHDIILNSINDSDICANSTRLAIKMTNTITAKWPEVKVFNHPEKIADTARNRIYELYKDLPGLYIPKVVKIIPESVADTMQLAKQHIGFPFLIRPCGAHQSIGLQIIRNENEARLLEKYAYDGSGYYITEFVDYKSDNGLYKKARLVIIGGKILPRHFMTGTDWLVHGNLHEEYMANNQEAKNAEENFINNFADIISKQSLASLVEIYNRSGLDYLGFDFSIRPDGTLLIFEINPAQNSFLKLDFEIFPYMKQARDNLINAFNQCIKEKTSA